MNFLHARLLNGMGWLVVATFIAAIGWGTVIIIRSILAPQLSDGELIREFHGKREDFEKICQMMAADTSVQSVSSDDFMMTNGKHSGTEMAPERLSEYRRLLSRIGVIGCYRYDDGPGQRGIFLPASARGTALNSHVKGFAYSDEELRPDVPSLDNGGGPSGPAHRSYRRIDGGWYLYRKW